MTESIPPQARAQPQTRNRCRNGRRQSVCCGQASPDDEVGKKETTKSELIRQTAHQWAIKKRLAPDAADLAQEQRLSPLQKQTVTELGEARKEIKTLLAQLKEAAPMQAIRSL